MLTYIDLYNGLQNIVINTSKTQLIQMGTSRLIYCIPSLQINLTKIPFTQTVKNLGVIFEGTLSWTEYNKHTIKKSIAIIHHLQRYISYVPRNISKILIQMLVFLFMDYGSVVNNDLVETRNIKLQRTQIACVRFILDVPKDDQIKPHF